MTAYDDTGVDTLAFHGEMLDDRKRTDSYLKAILSTVRPGDVVLDLGTGTGLLAYFAALAGAKRIYAVEQGPVAELARQISEQNGYSDRVRFINDWSTNVDLPEPVDVIVTETIGIAAFDEGIVGTVADARNRFLRGGGRIVPKEVSLYVGLVESSFDYAEVDRWKDGRYTFDFSPAGELAANSLWATDFSPVHMLTDAPLSVGVSLERAVPGPLRSEGMMATRREGSLHGLGCWFGAKLTDTVTLDTIPPNPAKSWSHGFLPLRSPLRVAAGDLIRVEIAVLNDGAVWEWSAGRAGVDSVENHQSTRLGASERLGSAPRGAG